MDLQQLKTKANTKLSIFWSALTSKQDAYFTKHGKFFQKLITNPVVDGVDSDYIAIEPPDEKHSADADFSFSSKIPFQISIDEWDRGENAGYSVTVNVELLNGDIYTRTRNNLNVDSGWSKVIHEIM